MIGGQCPPYINLYPATINLPARFVLWQSGANMFSSPMTEFLMFVIFILFFVGFLIFKFFTDFCLLQGYKNLGNRKAIKWFSRAIKFADIGCGMSNGQIAHFGKIITYLSLEEDDKAMTEFLFSNCTDLFITMIVAINRFENNVKFKGNLYKDRFPFYFRKYFDENVY
jgi:hypothetical protein